MTKRKRGSVAKRNKKAKKRKAKSNFADLGWSGETQRINEDDLFFDMEKELCCMKKCECIYPKICDKCKDEVV